MTGWKLLWTWKSRAEPFARLWDTITDQKESRTVFGAKLL